LEGKRKGEKRRLKVGKFVVIIGLPKEEGKIEAKSFEFLTENKNVLQCYLNRSNFHFSNLYQKFLKTN